MRAAFARPDFNARNDAKGKEDRYFVYQAALIGILNAQDKGAAVVAGLKISIQCGAQVAHMHIARGGRCKPGAYRISHGKITPTFVMM